MSMLTPPGMGGKYRITGNRYPRMRRPQGRRRVVLAAAGATVALGLTGWGTLQLIDVFSGGSDTAQAAGRNGTPCERTGPRTTAQGASAPAAGTAASAGKKLPKPADITVNVYNATKRTGLAKETADALKKRGFTIGKVGNAPAAYDKKVRNTGLLLGAPSATRGPFDVLAAQVPGTTTRNDARTGKDIDLIIGDRFTALTAPKDADRTLAALAAPKPAPSAKGC
ncbi:LytR C-terminal domain-containing protein [Streptomyces pactum]|uniref:LytR C-terminal domain-containing protein n=1 Tax=Streptomyces pactum TaxID=68249 RepID=A0ABS0NKV3_9ACTN|nr:LytR C-terminal domain-containing protein [Streptomyces pactum]MBH5335825.1 LytR C-terminal domain-containing protein [Streptomyces pactum]